MSSTGPGRRQATRSARTAANRPTNYYAKPFSYRASGASLVENDPPMTSAPGFFPAITHFTDSMAALPKEVQRHLTTLKETEGKAYQPDEAIAELVTAITRLPPPPHPLHQDRPLPFMQLSMANSINGSVNGSVVDGVAPKALPHSSSDMDMADAAATQPVDEYADRRNNLYRQLHYQVGEMTKILEEKNMVLVSMNETLSRQLARAETSFPHIENEVSEEARLGSNTHWALPHMKELRRTNGTTERRRDVTNVNNLAAAAAAVHENDIAATRSEARREAMLAKRSRAPASEYGFEDRSAGRKQSTSSKVRRAPEPVLPAANGSSSSAANKRRRVEKPSSVQGERAMSAALHGRLQEPSRANSRDNSTADAARKKPKPAQVQTTARKSKPTNSPSMASSPTRATFNTSTARAQSPARSSVPRGRQTSVASVAQDAARKRAVADIATRKQEDIETTAAVHARDTRAGTEDADLRPGQVAVEARRPMSAAQPPRDTSIKPEPTFLTAGEQPLSAPLPNSSHSRSNSKSTAAPTKPPTPHNIFADVAPLMSRSRSGRGVGAGGSLASPGASTPASGAASPSKRSHKRSTGSTANAKDAAAAMMAGGTPASSDDEGASIKAAERMRRARKPRGPTSAPDSGDAEGDDADADAENATASTADAELPPTAEADGEADADDGAEPLYCFCQQPSEGEMIACDNEACPTEWFHLECVALARAPKNSWFCSEGCKRQALRGKR